MYFSSFRCNKFDYPIIKFEPTREFNFEGQIYGFKVHWVFPYVNSVSAQRWYRINVKDYSISAQRWYRIKLKVLIIDFSYKEFYVVLEGPKTLNWVFVTQKERSLNKRIYSL